VNGKYGFVDVFGFDDELLCMVPQPTYALLLLFPGNEQVSVMKSTNLYLLINLMIGLFSPGYKYQ
jgi:hypothetical protein